MLARVDVLFYWNGIPDWFEKWEFGKSGVKLQLLRRGETTFGSSYREVRKTEGSSIQTGSSSEERPSGHLICPFY